MEKNFILKEGANPNYLATICKIGELYPIEGADKLVKTVINGYDIVIPKTMKEGDIILYLPVESCICEGFLSANNLYEFSEADKNACFDVIDKLISDAEYLMHPYANHNMSNEEAKIKHDSLIAEAKSMCGFFNKYGRVRMIKLRGQYSMGFVCDINALIKYSPELISVNWESLIGTQFNYIGADEFCWKYIPPIKTPKVVSNGHDRAWKKRTKKLKRFDRICT